MEAAPLERRRHPRFHQDSVPVQLYDYDRNAEAEKCYACDLSRQGIGIEAETALPVDKEFGFKLELPGGRTVSGMAVVKWSIPSGRMFPHGLEIVAMDRRQRRMLERHLNGGSLPQLELKNILADFVPPLIVLVMLREILRSHPEFYRMAVDNGPVLIFALGLAAAAALALLI